MLKIDTSGQRATLHQIHRGAHHERNLAMHRAARDLVRKLTNGVQVLARISRRLALRVVNEWYQRRAIHALHKLDDRLLADIGLVRGDIEFVVRCGTPWQRPQLNSGTTAVSPRPAA